MLDTFNDSKVANELSEPIVGSLFQVQIIPNPSVGLSSFVVEFTEQQIKTVSGFDAFERVPELIEQNYGQGAKGLYPGIILDQVIDLSFSANVNLRGDDGTNATTLIVLKKMKDKQYNRATGSRGLARDCVFTVIVRRITKDKKVWYTATCENCLFTADGVTGLDEVNIDSNEAADISFSIRSTKNKAQMVSDI